jgi:hypothetical protein
MVKLNKNLCWVSDETGETVELTEDEVIAMYNELQDDNKVLCEANEKLREELKAANGKAVLRRSGRVPFRSYIKKKSLWTTQPCAELARSSVLTLRRCLTS